MSKLLQKNRVSYYNGSGFESSSLVYNNSLSIENGNDRHSVQSELSKLYQHNRKMLTI